MFLCCVAASLWAFYPRNFYSLTTTAPALVEVTTESLHVKASDAIVAPTKKILDDTHTVKVTSTSEKTETQAEVVKDGDDFSKTAQIISMGLPKTGTTATAVALQDQLGLKVAHNMGDKLLLDGNSSCNAIINTLESHYDDLYYKHPNAKWIVTYTSNVTQWMDSVRVHNRIQRRKHIPCNFYGCDKGRLGGPTTTSAQEETKQQIRKQKQSEKVPIDDDLMLKELYDRYYVGLFAFLESKQVPYAYVDVRANTYRNLEWIHPNLQSPFEPKNTRNNRGQWPGC